MNTELVIFDMDGVIFEGTNFWLELHERYGTERQGLKLARKYMNSNYKLLARHVVGGLWKGKPAWVYRTMVDKRVYQPGVREVFEFLHRNRIRSAIVSSGPHELASRAQQELGIEEVWANRLGVENDVISGQVETMVPDGEKDRIGLKVMAKMGVDPSRVAFVGDSESDVGLAKKVALPIAYNSESKMLNRLCKYKLKYGELTKLIDILPARKR